MKRLLLALLLLAPCSRTFANSLSPVAIAQRSTSVYTDGDGTHVESAISFPDTGGTFSLSDSVDWRVGEGFVDDALLTFDLSGLSEAGDYSVRFLVHSATVGGPFKSYPIGMRLVGGSSLDAFPAIQQDYPGFPVYLDVGPTAYDVDVTGEVRTLIGSGAHFAHLYLNVVETDSGVGPASMLLSVASVPEPSSLVLAAAAAACLGLAASRQGRSPCRRSPVRG